MRYTGSMINLQIETAPASRSRLTSQGQVSVPAAVRRSLGLTPGAVLEWTEEGGRITVQRATRHSSAELHLALFPKAGAKAAVKTLAELKQGVAQYMQQRHAPKVKLAKSAKPANSAKA